MIKIILLGQLFFLPNLMAMTIEPEGIYETKTSFYKLPAQHDHYTYKTELWAQVYYPQNLPLKRHPIIVLLHGNKFSCQTKTTPAIADDNSYTLSGKCPDGYEMTPSYLGFDYLGLEMASWGYFVISINANLGLAGINEASGLIGDRGILVLDHLELLSSWNRSKRTNKLGLDLYGKLDFSNVGLLGHSRGADGVREAKHRYQTNNARQTAIGEKVNIRALLELAPTAIQSALSYTVTNIPWAVISGGCDEEVGSGWRHRPQFLETAYARPEFNPSPKFSFVIHGANHSFFNGRWQVSDAQDCRNNQRPLWQRGDTSSLAQQIVTKWLVSRFFRIHVGQNRDASLAPDLNGKVNFPAELTRIAPIDRLYFPGGSVRKMTKVGELATATDEDGNYRWNNNGLDVQVYNPVVVANSDQFDERKRFFELPFQEGLVLDLSQHETLSFDFGNNYKSEIANNIYVALIVEDSESMLLSLSDYVDVGPSILFEKNWTIGGPDNQLNTVLIPLKHFGEISLQRVIGLRFYFENSDPLNVSLGRFRILR